MTSEVEKPLEFSKAPERIDLPIRLFDGSLDPMAMSLGQLEAMKVAPGQRIPECSSLCCAGRGSFADARRSSAIFLLAA